MKPDEGILSLISWKTVVFSLMIVLSNDAAGQLPFQSSQWVEPDAASAQTVISAFSFDQYSSGAYSSAFSESWYNLYANPQAPTSTPPTYASISGPGIVGIGPASGFGSNQSALFTGFADNGSPGIVTIGTSIYLSDAGYLDGLSFDVYSGELPGGLHGPTSFYVQISTDSNFSVYWQSELVQLASGTANAIHWDVSNPDGNDANGDGIAVMGAAPSPSMNSDWRSFYYGSGINSATVDVRIIASGANSSLTGLGLDNIQFTGVVPEPASCLLLIFGLCLVGGRSRPPGRA